MPKYAVYFAGFLAIIFGLIISDFCQVYRPKYSKNQGTMNNVNSRIVTLTFIDMLEISTVLNF